MRSNRTDVTLIEFVQTFLYDSNTIINVVIDEDIPNRENITPDRYVFSGTAEDLFCKTDTCDAFDDPNTSYDNFVEEWEGFYNSFVCEIQPNGKEFIIIVTYNY